MNPLKKLAERLKVFNPQKEAIRVIEKNTGWIEDANAQQLLEGEQPNGSKIRPEYRSAEYARFKKAITPNPKRDLFTPNLKLTGDFHKAIKAKPTKNQVVFENNDPKADKLQRKYGELFGLNKENMEELKTGILLPELQEYTKKTLTNAR